MKKIMLLILIVAWWLSLIPFSLAADQTVTCTNSGCSGLTNSLFSELNMAPGGLVTKSIEVISNHNETMKLALSVSKKEVTDNDFIEFVQVAVVTDGLKNRFSGNLTSFLGSFIDLEKLESGQRRMVEISLSLDDVGNEFQGKQANFSFDLKIDQEVPGSGDGGVGGGVAASASPSPAILGVTAFFPQGQSFLESVLGVATPSALMPGFINPEGSVQGESSGRSWFWWLMLLFVPVFWLLWLRKRRRMD